MQVVKPLAIYQLNHGRQEKQEEFCGNLPVSSGMSVRFFAPAVPFLVSGGVFSYAGLVPCT